MEVLEGVEVRAGEAAALGEQGREFARPGTEGFGLFQQHGMAGECLAVGSAERHRIAFNAGPFAEMVVRRQNLPAAVGEGGDRLGVTPAEGGAPDIPRDAGKRVVVRRRTDIPRLALGFARGSASVLPDILPTLFPHAIRHIVERRLFRLRARPAFGQIRPDFGVRHRRFPVVVGPPVGDIESERCPVDVDVEPLAMARRGGIDRLARGPRIGQQERPIHGQPLGRCDGKRIAVIETDIAVPVEDLIVTESDLTAILGTCRYQDTRLCSGLAFLNLQVLYRDHGAVKELLLPVRGADAQPVAACDLQRRGRPIVLRAPADDHRHPIRIGPLPVRQRGEPAFPHQMRQRPHLGSCARQHHAGFIGISPLVAVPSIDQPGQRLFFIVPDMEPPTQVIRCNGRRSIAVAQRLGRSDLPGRKYKFPLHVLVVRKNTGAPLLFHRIRQEPRPLGRLTLDMGQDILQVRLLAPYPVHPDTANGITDQPQPRSCLNGLLLLGVACKDDLRSITFGETENVMRLARRQHPRFVDDDDGVFSNLDPARAARRSSLSTQNGRASTSLPSATAVRQATAVAMMLAPVFTVEIGDGPQCRGLARARRSFDDGDPAARMR